FVESFLGMVLVLIFMQSIPLLSPKRYNPTLKNEEIVCMIILIASVLTGMIGWQIYGAGIEQIFSRYFVLMFAFVGGAAIGSTVRVVAGLILSLANVANLYQMSLLGFYVLLGGLLKEGRKFGVAIGLFVGSLLIGVYGNADTLGTSLIETSAAILLFLFTPMSWFTQIAKYIPGTEEYKDEQEKYSQKVRNVTAERVEKYSEVYGALSKSFENDDDLFLNEEEERQATDHFLSQVTERTCQTCFMKERCWQKSFHATYGYMEQMKEGLSDGGVEPQLMRQFENHCVKSKKVLNVMEEEITFFERSEERRVGKE